ncbi:hypothetical protein [Pedobacter sp. GR22-10]|uniref:hypothetical protein n=1 Tax=Pedobacter sp. GR22-10 TaxID=2994472 RepID=UPI0022452ED3|nr:hypothetical protein [Pedobacter sp. GR22-10]MCX2431037.1 hypothetical protein [Pedobacter sp. GR22-10]
MNTQVLNEYGFNFIKKTDGTKLISNTSTSYIASYISEYSAPELIQEYIDDVDLCLSGQFDLVEDTTKSTDFIYAKLYPDGLYFDDDEMLPLYDLRELLSSWKEFLEGN